MREREELAHADRVLMCLLRDINRDIARMLLRSDAQCFSTEQYFLEHLRYVHKQFAPDGPPCKKDLTLARSQLLALPETVREVKPDVWAAVEQTP